MGVKMREDIKLVYSAKYGSQYYKPVGTFSNGAIKLIKVLNPHDANIHKNNIINLDTEPNMSFVIMHNSHITAEENFIKAMRVDKEYKRKLKAIQNFIRDGLCDSPVAMNEVKRIYAEGFKNVHNKKEIHYRQKIRSLFNNLMMPETKNIKNSGKYTQHIPADIRSLARKKGLAIERIDEFWKFKNGYIVPMDKIHREHIKKKRDCGFLIRDKSGQIIVGERYTMSDKQVIEFVTNFDCRYENLKIKVHLSDADFERLKYCRKILQKHKYNLRVKGYLYDVLQYKDVLLADASLKQLIKFCDEIKEKM